jgi:SAM-dependent methyltransferase
MTHSFINQTPVRMGSPEEFARIALVLTEASFDEATICRACKLTDMSDSGSIQASDIESADISPRLRLLIRLFLLPALVPRTELELAFDQVEINSFLSLGLLGTGEFGNDDFYSRVLLYPVAGFFIASDRHSLPDYSEFEPPPDIVFPAIFAGTLQFLRLLPRTWDGAALDLCSGTGIGAFVLGRHGKTAVSADITERAAAFARFNCALNNTQNVKVVRGDLYDAVAGRTFGCIVAHPPYVPSLEAKAIWRDGGTTGEELTRRIIAGLPEHLDPGGVFVCLSLGVDTQEGKFEERARAWLGDHADQFDVVFACQELRDPLQVLDTQARKYPELGPKLIQELAAEFRRAGVVKMPFGALCISRAKTTAHRRPWTARTKLSDQTEGPDFAAALTVHDLLSQPNFLANLEQATPRLAPGLEVKVTHVVHDGALLPADFLFEIDRPFAARVRFEGWMVPLLARLDGQTSLAKIYQDARAGATIPDEFKIENLAVLVARTLELGFTVLSSQALLTFSSR